MKAIKFLLPVLFAAVMLGNQSCSKYEEGPTISFRSKKARLVNDWNLKEYYKNGSKQDLNNTVELEIKDDGTAVKTVTVEILGTTTTDTYNYKWEFNSDKTKLILIYVDDDGKIYEDAATTYVITKLYEDEMWLTQNDGDDSYEYHYETK
jgi:hypothetical protein